MADWLLFGAGFAAGAFTGFRNLPLAAIGLGLVLLIAADRLGVFIH
jgi:hypothetical protein